MSQRACHAAIHACQSVIFTQFRPPSFKSMRERWLIAFRYTIVWCEGSEAHSRGVASGCQCWLSVLPMQPPAQGGSCITAHRASCMLLVVSISSTGTLVKEACFAGKDVHRADVLIMQNCHQAFRTSNVKILSVHWKCKKNSTVINLCCAVMAPATRIHLVLTHPFCTVM